MLDNVFNRFWITAGLCFLSGSVSALAMAPYNVWGALLIGFGALYLSLGYAANKKQAFALGWLFGFGYFVFGLYWIGNALLVEGNPYKWAWPLAVCGLPALLSFFPAFACVVCKRFLNFKAWYGYTGFTILIAVSEVLRGHLFTGFPWNLYGYTWGETLPILQFVSLESVYSLTALTIFWAGGLGFIALARSHKDSIIIGVSIIASFGAVYIFGMMRLIDADTAYHERAVIRVVQPNTPQVEKWERDKMAGHFKTALKLSRPTGEEANAPTIVIWPETALSPAYLNDPYTRQYITDMLGEYPNGAELITGALRYTAEDKTYHNSIVTIDQNGEISDIYDKSHLVPFGEYIPFQRYIPFGPVSQFTGLEAGAGTSEFSTLENLTYNALVCYEIIFPRKSILKGQNPDFIINVTNDAWYGDSPGPYQHLMISKFRAVENGTPVVRAANTGVSAIIDSYGRILEQTAIMEYGYILSPLPMKLSRFRNEL